MTLRKSSDGFTLIELMIVVVIVGVLTLVAYPAYRSFVVKANRAEAKSYLMHLAQRQQLYFNDSRTYAADAIELKSDATELDSDGKPKSPWHRVADNYCVDPNPAVCPDFFDVGDGPPPIFTITAKPKDGSLQATYKDGGDGDLSIANTGEKLHAGEPW